MNKNHILMSSYIKNHIVFMVILGVLAGCSTSTKKTLSPPLIQNQYYCKKTSDLIGKIVGDGQCVSFIKECSGAPNTRQWKPGAQVVSQTYGSINAGTIIATFLNGKYPNKTGWHAAVYIKHDASGIWVWDQWLGKPVHKRLIRIRTDKAKPANTAQEYRIVRFN